MLFSACSSPPVRKALELNGNVIDSQTGNIVPHFSFSIWAVDKPTFRNKFISEQFLVAETKTDAMGNYKVDFNASWKFKVVADKGVFCHSLGVNTRYFDVISNTYNYSLDLISHDYGLDKKNCQEGKINRDRHF